MLDTVQASLRRRAHRAIPAGCHTYSKGDDQFPANAPAFIVSGQGCRVTDPDGRRYLDWGMGLRSVVLGHAYPRVVDAAREQLALGSNFTRPAPLELELAERLIELIPAAEMVKLAKNGSDVTTAAVRLARAFTGRDMVALPREHPFYSFDDWFIGTTVVDAGVPKDVTALSATWSYGDLDSLRELFARHPGRIAAVITEVATDAHPPEGFLEGVRELTEREGALLIFDEMITGLRWDLAGAQHYYGVTPDMATFGKALANGFSVSALVGRRDVMELGGLEHDRERVFLLSATHGGETHALAAALATLDEMAEQDVTAHLWRIGEALQRGLNAAAERAGVAEHVVARGLPCSPVLAFGDAGLRTLFLQETCARGVLIPYIAPSFSHGDAEVEETVAAAEAAFEAVARVAGGEPLESLLEGPIVKPVFRRYNAVDLDA
jgi:glutamate-1-semialdehyde 2,1-aminomutase